MYYSIKCDEAELLIFQSLMSVISSEDHSKTNSGWMVSSDEVVEKAKEKQFKNSELTQEKVESFMLEHPEAFTKMGNYFYFHLDQEDGDLFDDKTLFSVFFNEF